MHISTFTFWQKITTCIGGKCQKRSQIKQHTSGRIQLCFKCLQLPCLQKRLFCYPTAESGPFVCTDRYKLPVSISVIQQKIINVIRTGMDMASIQQQHLDPILALWFLRVAPPPLQTSATFWIRNQNGINSQQQWNPYRGTACQRGHHLLILLPPRPGLIIINIQYLSNVAYFQNHLLA